MEKVIIKIKGTHIIAHDIPVTLNKEYPTTIGRVVEYTRKDIVDLEIDMSKEPEYSIRKNDHPIYRIISSSFLGLSENKFSKTEWTRIKRLANRIKRATKNMLDNHIEVEV